MYVLNLAHNIAISQYSYCDVKFSIPSKMLMKIIGSQENLYNHTVTIPAHVDTTFLSCVSQCLIYCVHLQLKVSMMLKF